jgi:hypothetical protein
MLMARYVLIFEHLLLILHLFVWKERLRTASRPLHVFLKVCNHSCANLQFLGDSHTIQEMEDFGELDDAFLVSDPDE